MNQIIENLGEVYQLILDQRKIRLNLLLILKHILFIIILKIINI